MERTVTKHSWKILDEGPNALSTMTWKQKGENSQNQHKSARPSQSIPKGQTLLTKNEQL